MAVVTASSGMVMGRASNSSFVKAHLPSSYRSSSSSSSLKNKDAEAPQLGFLSSQFSGLRISFHQIEQVKPISAPFRSPIQPVARRVCPFTGKKSNNKNLVSHSNHKTKKLQFVNLQKKRLWWEEGKRFVKLRLSTKALKTIEKHGLHAMAKKAGIELAKIPYQ